MACKQIIQGGENMQQSCPQQYYDILIIYVVLPNNSYICKHFLLHITMMCAVCVCMCLCVCMRLCMHVFLSLTHKSEGLPYSGTLWR